MNATGDEPDFFSRQNQPLDALLVEFGEQDLEWKHKQPKEGQPSKAKETRPAQPPHRQHPDRLKPTGKAPIHVDFVSFAYRKGVPGKKGWSHAQPLPPFDVRDSLEEVPSHLSWQDGLSSQVKFHILKSEGLDSLLDVIVDQTSRELEEAMRGGGFGYLQPLRTSIHVGSEHGKHRSVVVCEQVAQSLRQSLRDNQNGRWTQPCSVGTRHLALKNSSASNKSKKGQRKPKQKVLEEEW